MKEIIFDFSVINTEEKLYNYIEKELNINQYINGKWGRNLHAFWDLYAYSDNKALFKLKNYNNIKDKTFKKFIDVFIDYLKNIKGFEEDGVKIVPNPNFDYIILD